MSYFEKYSTVHETMGLPVSTHALSPQVFKKEVLFTENERDYKVELVLKWGDECKNGFNHFSVMLHSWVKDPRSLNYRDEYYGRDQQLLETHFPEYAHLLKYHLFSASGPFYYFENTLFLAGVRDFMGNEPGDQRTTYSGLKCWTTDAGSLEFSAQAPSDRHIPVISSGKQREIDTARLCAVWPEATDEQLSLPEHELFELLKARLPALVDGFKKEVEALGFVY